MKNVNIIMAATAIAAASHGAWAQDLRTEITVDRTVVPRERAASRIPSALPSVLAPAITPVHLSPANYTAASAITPSLTRLAPARYADTVAVSPYRGYAALGYFPVFNLGASAGYRIIDRRNITLGAWMQYDGNSYHGTVKRDDGGKSSYRNHDIAAGVDLGVRMARNSELNVTAAYRLGSTGTPLHSEPEVTKANTAQRADIAASWSSRPSSLAYSVGVRYGYFGFNSNEPYFAGQNENSLAVQASVAACGEGLPRLGLDAAYTMTRNSVAALPYGGYDINTAAGDRTLGVASLTPYYHARFGNVSARIGMKLDISTGGEGKKLHFAPDVRLSWEPSAMASVWANIGGGEHLNDMRSLYAANRYMNSGQAYQRSHVPLTVDAGINIGPVAGVTVSLFGGYAMANDWLMPAVGMPEWLTGGYRDFEYVNVRGWHGGIGAEWTLRSLLTLSARGEVATRGEGTHAYYLWRDRAGYRVEAGLSVHPMYRLDLEAGYTYSGKRSATVYDADGRSVAVSLGSVSDLRAGARYRVSDALSVFVRGENLLDHRYSHVPGVTAQGVHGLAGVELKF